MAGICCRIDNANAVQAIEPFRKNVKPLECFKVADLHCRVVRDILLPILFRRLFHRSFGDPVILRLIISAQIKETITMGCIVSMVWLPRLNYPKLSVRLLRWDETNLRAQFALGRDENVFAVERA